MSCEALPVRSDAWKVGLGIIVCLLAWSAPAGCNRPEGPSERAIKQGPGPGWASGGTAAMRGPYADPFVGATASCRLTPALTSGPCRVPAPSRRDLSEGMAGLPMRLSLRIVRAGSCEPVPGAEVEVWHAGPGGNYSGFAAGSFCNRSDARGGAARYGRGVQVTDASGRVDFDSVFPGWYPGRTVHVHYTVRVGGQEALTSQLIFDDRLTAEITGSHPDYRGRATPDTTNDEDGIAGQAGEVTLQTARRGDGALHAWTTIGLR